MMNKPPFETSSNISLENTKSTDDNQAQVDQSLPDDDLLLNYTHNLPEYLMPDATIIIHVDENSKYYFISKPLDMGPYEQYDDAPMI